MEDNNETLGELTKLQYTIWEQIKSLLERYDLSKHDNERIDTLISQYGIVLRNIGRLQQKYHDENNK